MPLDPVLAEDTRAWFRKAATDLRGAEADSSATPPILEDLVFHCQQAAEKAIKGFLTAHQQPFGKTHGLRERTDAGRGPLGVVAVNRAMVRMCRRILQLARNEESPESASEDSR